MSPQEMRDLKLPAELCQAIEEKYGSRFGSLEQFLIYALNRLVSDEAKKLDEEDQRLVEKRLRDLGYI